MSKPRIAIPIPTSFDPEYNDHSWPEYARAIEEAGGEAVPVPLDLEDRELDALAVAVDGILLPGSGADVDPVKYGQEKQEECAAPDPARERVDWRLLEEAERVKKPLLTICFGTQSLNVFRGGTLVQDLLPVPVNHRAGRQVAVAHGTAIAIDSLLGGLLTETEAPEEGDFLRLPVNSSHHQAIAIPGEGLRVVARSTEDGVIEAVEGPESGPFLLGLQWHPERTLDISDASRTIFAKFIHEAGGWRA
jgi:putative glutamine amidotransferase